MDKGYVKQIGTPQEVYTDPANVFVATFIGSPPMNIFNVKVLPNLDLDFGALLIKTDGNKDQEALKKHIGEEIILGVRPEHIKARLQMGPNKRIPIFVKLFELLGSDALIHIELTGTKITVKEKNSNIFEPNDKIDLIFDATKLYFFDKDTKDRIY
jgi:multiple sugar transport system ATP-binding protein